MSGPRRSRRIGKGIGDTVTDERFTYGASGALGAYSLASAAGLDDEEALALSYVGGITGANYGWRKKAKREGLDISMSRDAPRS